MDLFLSKIQLYVRGIVDKQIKVHKLTLELELDPPEALNLSIKITKTLTYISLRDK